MKAGDVKAARPSPEDSWYSTPMSDPNAALWASIRPPAHPSVGSWLRRQLGQFSLDVLAAHLQRALPALFGTRLSAQRGVLGAVTALGAGVGVLGYMAIGALTADESELSGVAAGEALVAPSGRSGTTLAAEPSPGAAAAARTAEVQRAALNDGASNEAPQALAATAAPTSEQVVQAAAALQPLDGSSADGDATEALPAKAKKGKAKAKRGSKHKAKAKARAASTPTRAYKPRRQASFKFN